MKRDRNHRNRKSIRLKGYDYRTPAWYFITICLKDRQHFFGEIRNGIMSLSVPGCAAWHFWREIPDHHRNAVLDEFIVMPNHLHGIIGIQSLGKNVETLHATSLLQKNKKTKPMKNHMSDISPKAGSVSTIMRSYKGAVTGWCNDNNHKYFAWQSRFYDHIIRNEKSLNKIREYIYNNPLRWEDDRENINQVHEQAVKYMIAEN